MNQSRAIASLALIFAFRMLGLFMVLPVFAPYAHSLSAATPLLIGFALGVYGLSQACLQMPFGWLSDRLGRKPIITLGLCFFILGSLIAAMSHNIYGIILGRALQGAGAIGSTLMATMADLTLDENRTKAMASIGMTIGASFSLALLIGPVLTSYFGVPGLFYLTALLGLCGLLVLHSWVPTPQKLSFHNDTGTRPQYLRSVLTNTQLLRLDFGIFSLHAILTSLFVAIPMVLKQSLHLSVHDQWLLYLPILLGSFLVAVPFIILAEKKRKMKPVFLAAIALLCLSQVALWFAHAALWQVALNLFLFFSAFNCLEASLPSLVSKIAPVQCKGTAMGIYSSAQFFGIFCGGTFGGWLYGNHHVAGVFYAGALLALIWLLIASNMQSLQHTSCQVIHLGEMAPDEATQCQQQLQQLPGVKEVAVAFEEGIAYLKVDKTQFNHDTLKQLNLGENYG